MTLVVSNLDYTLMSLNNSSLHINHITYLEQKCKLYNHWCKEYKNNKTLYDFNWQNVSIGLMENKLELIICETRLRLTSPFWF